MTSNSSGHDGVPTANFPPPKIESVARTSSNASFDPTRSLSSRTYDWQSKPEHVEVHKAEVLGWGGYGIVYKGIWRFGKVPVAVKCLKRGDEFDEEEFLHEVSVWWRLKHLNILPLFGACMDAGALGAFMFSPMMPNGTIMQYLRSNPNANTRATKLRLLYDVCSGLDYLHESSIIHTDLKPNNILVDSTGRAVVMDFGFAKNKDVQTSGTRIGTGPYMGPERLSLWLNNQKVSHAVSTKEGDIYAWAISCYEIWTASFPYGKPPKDEDAQVELYESILQGHRPDLSNPKLQDMPQELKDIMVKSWDAKPENRPESFDAIGTVLAALIEKEPEESFFTPAAPTSSTMQRATATDSGFGSPSQVRVKDAQPPPNQRAAKGSLSQEKIDRYQKQALDVGLVALNFPKDVRKALAALQSGAQSEITLENKNLGDDGAKAVAEALRRSETVTALNLTGNNVGNDAAWYLASVLKTNKTLENLGLASRYPLFELVRVISVRPPHTDNVIGDTGLLSLSEALKVNSTLQHIELGGDYGNRIEDDGIAALADALKQNKTLNFLLLGFNVITDEGIEAISNSMKVNESIKGLHLMGTKMTSVGAKTVAEFLKVNKVLESLSLGGTDMNSDGAVEIAEALQVNSTLQELALDHSNLGNVALRALTDALKVNKTLVALDLSAIKITEPGVLYLADGLKSWKGLKSLILESNEIGDVAAKAIATALKAKTSSLQRINLKGISDDGAEHESTSEIVMEAFASTSHGRKFLVAIDFTTSALLALDFVLSRILRPGDSILLAHVIPDAAVVDSYCE
ncbi:hypothetical protein HDU93_007163 [Gonapodya sp. JEL0774]|nr:hypothetical protein HDU93_007163 [Gonapodya sp. JEL0774]